MNYLKILWFTLTLATGVLAQLDTNSQHFYAFVCFDNRDDKAGSSVALSSDAVHWQWINNGKVVITPAIGPEFLMRDPCIYYDARTGIFHMVWTTGWNTTNIGYANSTDLVNWSPKQLKVPVGERIKEGCTCCWAPEIFYDDIKDSFMIYWSTDIGQMGKRTYYSMTKDFVNFTTPIKFFDPGYTVIDATILKVDNAKYYMFFKDERTGAEAGKAAKNIHFVTGAKPQGPWDIGPADNVSKALTIPNCEGPSAIKIGNEYRIYFDPYFAVSSPYRMIKVTDLNTTASPWPQGDTLKMGDGLFNFSHGTILEIPRDKAMLALYAVQTVNNDIPLGKRNTGCGTGAGLAFFPPLIFKAASFCRRKKKAGKFHFRIPFLRRK